MARLGRSSFEQSRHSQDLAVPWEKDLPPEKRRYDVRFIRGGGKRAIITSVENIEKAAFSLEVGTQLVS